MNSERSRAYGRVMRTLQELGPVKLQAGETDLVREAADTLLFSEDLDAPGAREALEAVDGLLDSLVESGRWTDERAAELRADLAACGPVSPVA